jgi:hypothetical protein
MTTNRRTTIPRPLESAVLRECLSRARDLKIPCFRRNVATVTSEYKGKTRLFRSGEPSQSDLYGWLPIDAARDRAGIHFECEVKRPGEVPTHDQINWLHNCNAITGAAFWIDNSTTFTEVLNRLIQGMSIEYSDTEIGYRVRIKGSKRVTSMAFRGDIMKPKQEPAFFGTDNATNEPIAEEELADIPF